MDKVNTGGLVALGLILAFGGGIGLGAEALEAHDFAMTWLGATAGLLAGLLGPQVSLQKRS